MKIVRVATLLLSLVVTTAFVVDRPTVARTSTARADTPHGARDISARSETLDTVYTSEQIDALLPHRYPFALVDKVVEYDAGKRAVGIKCVTKNEEFFNGHFPGRPIMPGVLQVEALAQLAGIVCLQMDGATPGAVFFFAGVDGVKWKRPVVPGDVLVMEVEIKKWKAKFGIAKATGRAYVDGQLVVEVDEMTFALAK
ncbi:3R-hydroxyacyl-[acyl carrier protein] dehydrase [Phaeodactylum tricornutum CCAP 1055/1]|jgi:3-hydroxyacyl-[acyl-carrier-protein] dehydratase|uniref:3-hydroxyacyl-[acyl-carrier-protein] dehydratase n=2 Tax=Phaeodactylum tricornutum TaxID=2850 RepID=B7S3L6_PHATC|nr:3R-hydroxyacyl-[acyl carrier protein] dehydrase [Phaeodactylum tricornutum CCAP 1055/1]EEC42858.1 3R-hydroxyacyl-[acyl carrier protein] dehydrase [Phaeodactylum tricornutum CCAP 1055/1]|eukprot:XP_002176151.1 3R-hydroxyacyl-[acyl carrier protein] dehydrase [Phaeodactylum tricornutum CCAP 1055/1]